MSYAILLHVLHVENRYQSTSSSINLMMVWVESVCGMLVGKKSNALQQNNMRMTPTKKTQ